MMNALITVSVTAFIINIISGGMYALKSRTPATEQSETEQSEAPQSVAMSVPLSIAILPLTFLMMSLCVNVASFGDNTLGGPNQLALLASAGIAALLAQRMGAKTEELWDGVKSAVSDTLEAILILLIIGSLAGTWMLSGVVPAMIDYGLMMMSPSYFLIATCMICALVSLASGSSWSTVATVGVALIGVGQALGFSPGVCAGAILSGAYFGDKMSPLSDTTNLAPAMAGGSLIPHIRAMVKTTVPAFTIALVIFGVMGLGTSDAIDNDKITSLHQGLRSIVWIHPVLLLVPLSVAVLIALRVPTLATLTLGTLFGGLVAAITQPDLIQTIAGEGGAMGAFKAVILAMSDKICLTDTTPELQKLLTAKGMYGMLNTVWLILCALAFGGVMERSGFLNQISEVLLRRVQSRSGLVTATATTSVFLNVSASDQYLAIVVPGRMYRQRFADQGLAPEALSRTLEDAGTVTSVLIPWNTCGATQASVLGVATAAYLPYCFFNWLSPIITVLFAHLGWYQPLLPSDIRLDHQDEESESS
jgi:NhaC family Na+:H+ antiporter